MVPGGAFSMSGMCLRASEEREGRRGGRGERRRDKSGPTAVLPI